jgi:hypothetical protein
VKRVAKTPRVLEQIRWASGSRLTLQSIVARIVRCRSGRSRTARGEQGQALLEALGDPAGGQKAHLRRRELDREREALEAPADVGDVRRVVLVDR